MTNATSKQEAYEREVARLNEVDTRNEFIRRYYPLYLSLKWAVYPISVIMCIALTSTHLYVNFINMIGVKWIVILLVILASVFLEIWKNGSSNALFDGLSAGDYHPTNKKFWLWLMSVVGFLFCFGGGIYFDFKGAPIVTKYIKERQIPPTNESVADIESRINSYYDQKIEDLNNRQDQALKTKWKGNITRGAVALSTQLEESKQAIEAQRDSSLTAAKLENKVLVEDYNNNTANTSYWIRGLIIFFMAGGFIYFAFNSVYNDLGKDELKKVLANEAEVDNKQANASSPTPDFDQLATLLMQKLGLNNANLSMMQNNAAGTTANNQHQPPNLGGGMGFRSIQALHQSILSREQKDIDAARQMVADSKPAPTPSPQLDASATSAPTGGDCDHMRTQVDTQVEEGIQELQNLLVKMSLQDMVRLWKSHKSDWQKWNSTRYEADTREKHQVEHFVFMQAIERELTRRGEDLPTVLGKAYKRGLKPVEI